MDVNNSPFAIGTVFDDNRRIKRKGENCIEMETHTARAAWN